MRKILIALVKVYRYVGSPAFWALGARCRFHPTCSQYALLALSQHRPMKATALIGRRLLRCGPWSEGGVDPVPDKAA
ncbi:MAG: membrane protein insertion efficiency factor YidD [bacterium]